MHVPTSFSKLGLDFPVVIILRASKQSLAETFNRAIVEEHAQLMYT
jgi:hypothetical protein